MAASRSVGSEKRSECLRDDKLTGEIDFDLLPEVGDRLVEQGTRHRDTGVVHQAEKRCVSNDACHPIGGVPDSGFVRHVEKERCHTVAEDFAQAVGVTLTADAREHRDAMRD
jgi:hypothetical protein